MKKRDKGKGVEGTSSSIQDTEEQREARKIIKDCIEITKDGIKLWRKLYKEATKQTDKEKYEEWHTKSEKEFQEASVAYNSRPYLAKEHWREVVQEDKELNEREREVANTPALSEDEDTIRIPGVEQTPPPGHRPAPVLTTPAQKLATTSSVQFPTLPKTPIMPAQGPETEGDGGLPPPGTVEEDDDLHSEKESEIKFGLPEEFRGGFNQGDKFLRQCELYFRTKPKKFAKDETKILFTLTYMKGGLVEPFVDKIAEGLIDNEEVTWKSFKNDFERSFMHHDKAQRLLSRLENMKQGSQSVEAFILAFESTAAQTTLDDTAKVLLLKRAINPGVLNRILNRSPLPSSVDFEAWTTAVKEVADAWETMRNSSQRNFSRPYNQSWRNTSQQSNTSITTPNQYTGTSANRGWSRGTFSRGEGRGRSNFRGRGSFNQNRNSQNCFRCGKTGHMARNCTVQNPMNARTLEVIDEEQEKQAIKKEKNTERLRSIDINDEEDEFNQSFQ